MSLASIFHESSDTPTNFFPKPKKAYARINCLLGKHKRFQGFLIGLHRARLRATLGKHAASWINQMEESYVVKLGALFGKWLTIFHNFSVSNNQDHGKEYKRSDFNKYSI